MDPMAQSFTLNISGGGTTEFSISDIDDYYNYGVRISINYSSQIGASFILLIVLLLLTRPEKHSSPIFLLNATALAANTIRNILQILYFTGPFYEFYTYISADYSTVPGNDYRISIAGITLTLLLVMCLEASLVLQVHAVCVTLRPAYRRAMLVVSIFVALSATGFHFAMTVANAQAIVAATTLTTDAWLPPASTYAVTASICFFSAVFAAKLALSIRARRRMGLAQFGPMQIVFIMGCQTLFVPAIFAVLQNFTEVPELASQTLTLTAIFLPLSSMWASATVQSSRHGLPRRTTGQPSSAQTPSSGHGPFSDFGFSAIARSKKTFRSLPSSQSTTDGTLTVDSEKGLHPGVVTEPYCSADKEDDLDKEMRMHSI